MPRRRNDIRKIALIGGDDVPTLESLIAEYNLTEDETAAVAAVLLAIEEDDSARRA